MDITTTTFAILGTLCVIGMIVAGVGEVIYIIYKTINKLLKKWSQST